MDRYQAVPAPNACRVTAGKPARVARTLLGVRVAQLRWDLAAGHAEAVLVSAADRQAYVSCRGQAPGRRVRLPAGTPVRLTWGHDGG